MIEFANIEVVVEEAKKREQLAAQEYYDRYRNALDMSMKCSEMIKESNKKSSLLPI